MVHAHSLICSLFCIPLPYGQANPLLSSSMTLWLISYILKVPIETYPKWKLQAKF